MPFKTNRFLDAFTGAEQRALASSVKRIELKQHQVLYDAHETVTRIYFPTDAAISLVMALSTGEVIETAMVGRDGLVGAAAALNGRVSLNRAVVQIGGGCFTCDVDTLRNAMKNHPAIRSRLSLHEQALFAQVQQSAACNITHDIENRLARWLLRAADLHGGDELPLTQEYVAEMLGVRRTSVSVVAHTLQQAGMISYTRGNIKLMNIIALRETACECYETVRLNYEALFHPSNE